MLRFTPITLEASSGIPYVNTDFTNVLQDEHIKAYASILDGINYGSTSSTEPRNSGIILSGCKILATPLGVFQMGFTNSVVYFDGEFYENNPTYTGTTPIGNVTFWIVPGPTVSELRTLRTDLTTTSTASQTRYFNYVTTPPTTGPYIKFSSSGSSRYYQRILKYFTSRVGDVYVRKSLQYFDINGDGFNDMEGFTILDSNSGITGMPNLSGKFLKGWDQSYASQGYKPGDSAGGSHSHRITKNESAQHQHTTSTAKYAGNDTDLQHDHYMNVARHNYRFFTETSNGLVPIDQNPSDVVNPDTPTGVSPAHHFRDQNTGSIFTIYPKSFFQPTTTRYLDFPVFTGRDSTSNSQLQLHKHSLVTDFGDGNENNPGLEHENRPPYFVVVYYTKKQNT